MKTAIFAVFFVAGCVTTAPEVSSELPMPQDAKELAPSGDPRLYFSVPPYVTDGVRRKDANSVGHKGLLQKTVKRLEKLAACGEKCKADFETLLEAWFGAAPTALKPDFTYAQYKPNKPDDGIGIIEVREIIRVVHAADTAHAVSPGFKAWLVQLDGWLKNSVAGKREAARDNNHATFYYATRLTLLRATRTAAEARGEAKALLPELARLERTQFAPDGAQPEELERTRPLHYSLFNLEAWALAIGTLDTLGLAAETAAMKTKAAAAAQYLRDAKRFSELEKQDVKVHQKNDFAARLAAVEAMLGPRR